MALDIAADSITQHLGPNRDRYFAEGFKRVAHALTDLEIRPSDGRGTIRAFAELTYPENWSQKATGRLRPHLSSVDALILSVELADAYLTHAYGLRPEQRQRMWLRSFDMRAAASQGDLDRFDVVAVATDCAVRDGLHADETTAFECHIGTIRVNCVVEHAIGPRALTTAAYASSTEILGDADRRYYGDGYKRRTQHIDGVRPSADGTVVEARIRVEETWPILGVGFAGAYQPATSMIDCMLSLAQLAQVLAYRIDGIERAKSNTLWMRRVAMSTTTPSHSLALPLDALVAVSRSRIVGVGSDLWRVLGLVGHFGEIQAQASLAHALPDVATLLDATAPYRVPQPTDPQASWRNDT